MATASLADLLGFVDRVVTYVEEQAGGRLLKVHSDQDTTMTSFSTDKWSADNAIQLKTSAPYIHQQVAGMA